MLAVLFPEEERCQSVMLIVNGSRISGRLLKVPSIYCGPFEGSTYSDFVSLTFRLGMAIATPLSSNDDGSTLPFQLRLS